MIRRSTGPGARTPGPREHLDKLAEALETGDRLLGRVALTELNDYVYGIDEFLYLAGFHGGQDSLDWGRKRTTTRQTARIPRFFEQAASRLLEGAYGGSIPVNPYLSTSYGMTVFAQFLAVCRVIAKEVGRQGGKSRTTRKITSDLRRR